MNRPIVYSGASHASLDTGKISAYYGPEERDERTGDWCTVVWKNQKEVARYTNEQLLEITAGNRPSDLLLAGLALYLGK